METKRLLDVLDKHLGDGNKQYVCGDQCLGVDKYGNFHMEQGTQIGLKSVESAAKPLLQWRSCVRRSEIAQGTRSLTWQSGHGWAGWWMVRFMERLQNFSRSRTRFAWHSTTPLSSNFQSSTLLYAGNVSLLFLCHTEFVCTQLFGIRGRDRKNSLTTTPVWMNS